MRSQYSLDEQETIINMMPSNVSKFAEVYTCIPGMIQRILKLHEEYPEDVAVVEGDDYINATVPREWIKIQPKRKCTLTDEQKKANAERLAALRQAKKEAQGHDST